MDEERWLRVTARALGSYARMSRGLDVSDAEVAEALRACDGVHAGSGLDRDCTVVRLFERKGREQGLWE